MTEEQALQRCELFAGLPEQVRDIVLQKGTVRLYARGQVLLTPQERLDQLGVVVTGRIHQMHISPDGEYQLMAAIDPPRILGADLVCTRTRLAPYHLLAAEVTRVFWFPGDLWDGDLLPWKMALLERLVQIVSHINMKKEYRLAILAQRGLRQRILTYLTMQADKHGTATVRVPFSREEMASFLCVNRSALSHELSRMAAEGLIDFHKNVFTLHNWEKGREGLCP